MLIIRKELKVGLGIAAAVLGVAVVYGGMSLLSSGGSSKDEISFRPGDSSPDVMGRGLDDAVSGLPPAEGSPADLIIPDTATNNVPPVKADPFAESTRADGQPVDQWTAAWNTGRIVKDVTPEKVSTPTNHNDSVIRTATPDQPTRTDTTTTIIAPAAEGKYKIASGDTFSSIASKLYGKSNLYTVIEKANPGINPSRLKIGQEINVPSPQAVSSVADSITTTATVVGTIDASKQYRVQAGDTLHKISQKLYGKTKFWAAIYDANKAAIGPDAGRIKVGAVLNLPQIPTAN